MKTRTYTNPKAASVECERVTFLIPVEIIERARNASYWDRVPLAQIFERAVKRAVDAMERDRGARYRRARRRS